MSEQQPNGHKGTGLDNDQPESSHIGGSLTPITATTNADMNDNIHTLQVAQSIRAIPLLLLFHAAATISLQNLAKFQASFLLVNLWQVLAAAVGLGFATCFLMWHSGRWQNAPDSVLRGLECLALMLGLVWAVPIASVVHLAQPSSVIPVAGITLAMLSVGVVSLIRVPTGAVVFLCLVSAALGRSLYESLNSNQGMAALLCVIYCLVLAGVTLNSHLDFLRRAKAETEVNRQNEVIKLLLNDFERDARDWLWETDSKGRLTYVSPRLVEVLQSHGPSLHLMPLRHVLADHTTTEEWRKLEQAMAVHMPFTNLQIELTLNDKAVFWQLTAHPLHDHSNRHSGYRGVCRDVTVTQEAQRRIEAAMETSEKANAAKSQFLAVISHELRTPINAIVGFSELLARDTEGKLKLSSRREFAETILESSRHLQTLINDLLDVTRIERGSFALQNQQIDAAELVEVAIKLCREQAEKSNVNIVARLMDGVFIVCDVTRLKQVIINLLANAIKFSSDGSFVNIDMQRGSAGQLMLTIKDGGIGIASLDIERVFDPFVQADSGLARRYGGAGLGLPIARRIARLHDGDVTLDSSVGAGTTANLMLPQNRVSWPRELTSSAKQVA